MASATMPKGVHRRCHGGAFAEAKEMFPMGPSRASPFFASASHEATGGGSDSRRSTSPGVQHARWQGRGSARRCGRINVHVEIGSARGEARRRREGGAGAWRHGGTEHHAAAICYRRQPNFGLCTMFLPPWRRWEHSCGHKTSFLSFLRPSAGPSLPNRRRLRRLEPTATMVTNPTRFYTLVPDFLFVFIQGFFIDSSMWHHVDIPHRIQ